MIEDAELLRRYAHEHVEEAFAEIVRRHLDFVYSSALRQVNGDAHLARDVAQLVFTDLARKAPALIDRGVLAGWLFTSTRFAAAKLIRAERRRHAREMKAHAMENLSNSPGDTADWGRVRPVLDEAIADLSGPDREAILLRYFEGREFAEIGRRLQLNENTARMRVDRALDKLHGLLARRGVTSTAAALASVLAEQAVVAAPAGLALTVTGAALTAAATGAGAGAIATAATLMSMTKLQLGLTGAIVIAGASGLVLQQNSAAELRREMDQLRSGSQDLAALQRENNRLASALGEVQQLRVEDAELARLRDETAALQAQFAARARAAADEAQRREKMAAEARQAAALKRAETAN